MTKATTNTETAKTFTRGKSILLPTISIAKMKEGESMFFEALAEIETKPDIDHKTGVIKQEGGEDVTLSILKVNDLQNEHEGEIVIGYMIQKALAEYDKVTGLRFEIEKGATKGRTIMWTVYALED